MVTANLPCAKQFNVFDEDVFVAQLVRLQDETKVTFMIFGFRPYMIRLFTGSSTNFFSFLSYTYILDIISDQQLTFRELGDHFTDLRMILERSHLGHFMKFESLYKVKGTEAVEDILTKFVEGSVKI